MNQKIRKTAVILSTIMLMVLSLAACNKKEEDKNANASSTKPAVSTAPAASVKPSPAATTPATKAPATKAPATKAPVVAAEPSSLTFIGEAAVKIKSKSGKVLYIDPAIYSGDYSEEADVILITSDDADRQPYFKVKAKASCTTITRKEALVDKKYKTFDLEDFKIEAVASGGNQTHTLENSVGYLITVDGVTIYYAGGTSMIDEMKKLKDKKIDIAMYPVDGVTSMDVKEAIKVSNMIGAKKNIPVHPSNAHNAPPKENSFDAKGKLIMEKGQSIPLKDK